MKTNMTNKNDNLLQKTLSILIPRSEMNKRIALQILLEYRNRMHTKERYDATEWKEFAERLGISESKFQSVQNSLRDAGMLLKRGGHHEGEYTISTKWLDELINEWHGFLTTDDRSIFNA